MAVFFIQSLTAIDHGLNGIYKSTNCSQCLGGCDLDSFGLGSGFLAPLHCNLAPTQWIVLCNLDKISALIEMNVHTPLAHSLSDAEKVMQLDTSSV